MRKSVSNHPGTLRSCFQEKKSGDGGLRRAHTIALSVRVPRAVCLLPGTISVNSAALWGEDSYFPVYRAGNGETQSGPTRSREAELSLDPPSLSSQSCQAGHRLLRRRPFCFTPRAPFLWLQTWISVKMSVSSQDKRHSFTSHLT